MKLGVTGRSSFRNLIPNDRRSVVTPQCNLILSKYDKFGVNWRNFHYSVLHSYKHWDYLVADWLLVDSGGDCCNSVCSDRVVVWILSAQQPRCEIQLRVHLQNNINIEAAAIF